MLLALSGFLTILLYGLLVVAGLIALYALMTVLTWALVIWSHRPTESTNEGVVVSSDLRRIDQEFTGSDNGQPLPAVEDTVVRLDTGMIIPIPGNVTGICAPGNRVRITRSKRGLYTIANLTGNAPEAK